MEGKTDDKAVSYTHLDVYKRQSLGSGPVQATGTALHPDLLHRNVKKICLRQIFSVGRNGFAARRELRRRQGYTSICSIK